MEREERAHLRHTWAHPQNNFLILECFSSERGHAGDERAHPNISFFRAQTQTQSQTQHVERSPSCRTPWHLRVAALSGSSQNFSGLRCYDRNDDRGMARDARANLRRRGLDLRHRALELRLHRLLERIACAQEHKAAIRSFCASHGASQQQPHHHRRVS